MKCFEDISEEACDADGIYVVLQNQRRGKRFEYCWSVGFKPIISTGEGPKTYALDRAATGTGKVPVILVGFY